MPRYRRVRPGVVVADDDPRRIDRLVDEAIARLEKLTNRDEEFHRRFGRWTRPDHAPKYPIEAWAAAWVRWHPNLEGIIDVEHFVKSFPDKADRVIIGEIARFVAEEYVDKFVTDKTLKSFRIEFLRRLDAVGF
jgi:hypothetical protein